MSSVEGFLRDWGQRHMKKSQRSALGQWELTLHGDGQDADCAQCSLPLEGVHVLIKEVRRQVLGQSFCLLKELRL